MSNLHTVNKTPHSGSALAACLRAASPGDAVLLIEDGVYTAVTGSDAVAACREGGVRLYALRVDVEARGLESRLAGGVEMVDDAGFVGLCCEFGKVCSWY